MGRSIMMLCIYSYGWHIISHLENDYFSQINLCFCFVPTGLIKVLILPLSINQDNLLHGEMTDASLLAVVHESNLNRNTF